jgi:hypothetical protein
MQILFKLVQFVFDYKQVHIFFQNLKRKNAIKVLQQSHSVHLKLADCLVGLVLRVGS